MKFLTNTFFAFLLAVIFTACGSGEQAENKEADLQDVQVEEENSELKAEFKEATSEMPSPLEISQFIQETGAAYNSNILNPYEDVNKYLTTNQKKAMNLGVYVADLGYSCAYYVQSDIIQYVNAVKVVSDELGVTDAFGKDKIAEFEQSMPNKDSLIKVITESIYMTDEILVNSDKLDVASLILVGSFIEGLHISTSIVTDYPSEIPDEIKFQILDPIIAEIKGQDKTLTTLLGILAKFEGEDSIDEMESQLNELKAIYDNLGASADESGEETMPSTLSSQDFELISNKVSEIRSQIIS